MIWFTADNHFGHENIIKFCNRPFDTVGEMDRVMIERWNDVVRPGDTVYHLGDFTLGDQAMAHSYLVQLNGHINMLTNLHHHDKRWINEYPGMYTKTGEIELLQPLYDLEVPEYDNEGRPQTIVLCHWAMRSWNKSFHGSWHLFGHSHGRLEPHGLSFDVGVDSWGFAPVSIERVAGGMQARKMRGIKNFD